MQQLFFLCGDQGPHADGGVPLYSSPTMKEGENGDCRKGRRPGAERPSEKSAAWRGKNLQAVTNEDYCLTLLESVAEVAHPASVVGGLYKLTNGAMKPILFFGTPDFAVPTLAALVAAGMSPDLVVSQPSRPAKRGQRLADPPVVGAARELGIACEQVAKVRDPAFLARLAELRPGVAVVVAFGQIFPRVLLDLPRFGCVNLHGSLLPRWRGAAPIQAAIAAGDPVTGVSTMIMEEGLDSGPVLLQAELAIGGRETAGELSERLAALGGPLVVETLRGLLAGSLAPRSQDDSLVTLAPKLRKEEARTRWDLPAFALERTIRAFLPWPGAEMAFGEEWVKVIAASAPPASTPALALQASPGTVVAIERDRLLVAAGEGTVLAIERAQRAGRGPVSGGELARALHLAHSDRLA